MPIKIFEQFTELKDGLEEIINTWMESLGPGAVRSVSVNDARIIVWYEGREPVKPDTAE